GGRKAGSASPRRGANSHAVKRAISRAERCARATGHLRAAASASGLGHRPPGAWVCVCKRSCTISRLDMGLLLDRACRLQGRLGILGRCLPPLSLAHRLAQQTPDLMPCLPEQRQRAYVAGLAVQLFGDLEYVLDAAGPGRHDRDALAEDDGLV